MKWKDISRSIDSEISRLEDEKAIRDFESETLTDMLISRVETGRVVHKQSNLEEVIQENRVVAIESGKPEEIKQAWKSRAEAN
jgi:predicted nucleic acid-binding protein